MERIEKTWKDLDFDKVDFSNGNWNCGRGGHSFTDKEWFISYLSEDMVETIYKMPECINEMLRRRYSAGRRELISKIHDVLQI